MWRTLSVKFDVLSGLICLLSKTNDNYLLLFSKLNESTFDTQITKKMGYYKILEVMYSRLSKDDVHSKESKINQVFHGSSVTEGNELTKTLIK